MSTKLSEQEKLEKKKRQEEQKRQKALKDVQSILEYSEKFAQFSTKKIEERILLYTESDSKKCSKISSEEMQYFVGELRSYQEEGVLWLKTLFINGLNGILADEMGLGKTIQVIALISSLIHKTTKGYYLIVVPLSTLPNWVSEFKRFAPKIPIISFHGSQEIRGLLMKTILMKNYKLDGKPIQPVIITNFESIKIESNFFHELKYQYVILDEGHRIKNHLSQIYREVITLQTKNKLILTGTPLQNNLLELWSLLHYLFPRIFKTSETFCSLIMIEELQDYMKLLETEKTTNIISKLHRIISPFMLRRLKKDVLRDLVPKKEILVYCTLTNMQKDLYFYIIKKFNETSEQKEETEVLPMKRKCTFNINYREFNSAVKEPLSKKRKLEKIENSDDEDDEDFFPFPSANKLCVENESSENKNYETDMNEHHFKKASNKENVSNNEEEKPPFISLLKMVNPTMAMKKCVDHPYLIKCPIDYSLGTRTILIDENLVKQSGKMIVLDALLKRLKETSHKVLIFSTFVVMLNLLEEYMIFRNYNYRKLDGGDSLEKRDVDINAFNNDDDIFVFLISTRAGGLGLNLTAADTVIFYDRDWNPQVDIQAQDRCHRIGQKNPVMIYTLITKGTIDETIIECGEKKRKLEKLIIQSKYTRRNLDLTRLKEMLEDESQSIKINSNGLLYTEDELDKLLDRSELYTLMQNTAQK